MSPSGLLGDDMLPLAEITRCLDQFDIRLAAIDVISTGSRSADTGAVVRTESGETSVYMVATPEELRYVDAHPAVPA